MVLHHGIAGIGNEILYRIFTVSLMIFVRLIAVNLYVIGVEVVVS